MGTYNILYEKKKELIKIRARVSYHSCIMKTAVTNNHSAKPFVGWDVLIFYGRIMEGKLRQFLLPEEQRGMCAVRTRTWNFAGRHCCCLQPFQGTNLIPGITWKRHGYDVREGGLIRSDGFVEDMFMNGVLVFESHYFIHSADMY